jgi:hypothetical protein
MTFGMSFGKGVVRACVLLLVGGIAMAAGEATDHQVNSRRPDWTVEQLFALLKVQREPSVAFEEVTYLSFLTEPLLSRGILRFTPPATFEKEIREPYHERYLIDGDHVVFESTRKGIKKMISLEDNPALRSFVDAFRTSFTGDVARLMQVYEATVDGDRRKWTLLLRPLEQSGKSVVDYILLSGEGGRIDSIEIRAPDGDRSVMTLRRGTPQ